MIISSENVFHQNSVLNACPRNMRGTEKDFKGKVDDRETDRLQIS
jgi:hypothetical protein